jgi:hypothetical protein
MNISKAVILTSIFIAPALFCTGQTSANNGSAASPAVAPFTPSPPSDILQRSLGEVQQVVFSLKLDKWKRGSVRDEAGTNVAAIQRDLE